MLRNEEDPSFARQRSSHPYPIEEVYFDPNVCAEKNKAYLNGKGLRFWSPSTKEHDQRLQIRDGNGCLAGMYCSGTLWQVCFCQRGSHRWGLVVRLVLRCSFPKGLRYPIVVHSEFIWTLSCGSEDLAYSVVFLVAKHNMGGLGHCGNQLCSQRR